jgi:hypothetical protein
MRPIKLAANSAAWFPEIRTSVRDQGPDGTAVPSRNQTLSTPDRKTRW